MAYQTTNQLVRDIELNRLEGELENVENPHWLKDYDWHAIGKALQRNESVEGVQLHWLGEIMGDEGVRPLAEALLYNKRLKYFYTTNDCIGDEGAFVLADALRTNETLLWLSLYNNKIGTAGMIALADALKVNSRLEMIDVGNAGDENQLGKNTIHDEAAEAWSEVLVHNQTMSHLFLSETSLSDAGVTMIANSLKHNNYLVHLDVSGNKIGNAGCACIALALEQNTFLRVIDLNKNYIDDDGCEMLAKMLTINSTLCDLYIGDNSIGDTGAKYLCTALHEQADDSYFNELRIHNNSITNEGAKAFAALLSENRNMIHLHLYDNPIGSAGARILLKSLRNNSTLFKLELEDPKVKNLPDFEENRSTTIDLKILDKIETKLKSNRDRAEDSFRQVLNSDLTAPWNRSRVMLVGQGCAGKSATVRSLGGKNFNPVWDSTIGAAVYEADVEFDGGKWFLAPGSVDMSNVQELAPLAARVVANRKRTGIVPKGAPKSSLRRKKPKGKEHIKRSPRSATGSKNAIKNGQNSAVAIKPPKTTSATGKMVKEVKRDFSDGFIISARKTVMHLSIWDFGGQEVFYNVHHIFLTKNGVYLLVFDTRELLIEAKRAEALKYITFWLRSIKLHAPQQPMLLVGTFLSDVDYHNGLRVANETLEGFITDQYPQICRNEADNLVFYPIDNREQIGVVRLKNSIEKLIRDENTQREIPLRWIVLLDEIIKRKSSSSYLNLSEVRELAFEAGLTSSGELEEALTLFHERGSLVHLKSTAVLNEFVIIKPQWLITNISKLIRDKSLHPFNPKEIEAAGLGDDLQLLLDKSLVTRDFLSFVWNSSELPFMLDFMQHGLLLSRWTSDKYLVPSLLHPAPENIQGSGLKCVFDFSKTFLPTGVFERLICLCVANARSTDNISLYASYGSLSLNLSTGGEKRQVAIDLEEKKESNQIVLFVKEPKLASNCFFAVQSMIRKLNADVMREGLVWNVYLENESGRMIDLEAAKAQSITPWFNTDVQDIPEQKAVDLASFLGGL